jgi:hypothetical protein
MEMSLLHQSIIMEMNKEVDFSKNLAMLFKKLQINFYKSFKMMAKIQSRKKRKEEVKERRE